MSRFFLIAASFYGFVGVAAGAFGSHTLSSRLSSDMLEIFETAVRYQLYHIPGLALAGWAAGKYEERHFFVAGWLFVCGVALFSGSLYILSLSGAHLWGAVTPVGGVGLLVGWFYLGWGFLKTR